MKDILETDSVQLGFGSRKILQSIYLKAETGRVTGLLGRNGCGKSSLLKVIYGDISAEQQSIRLNGKAWVSGSRDPAVMRMLPHFGFIPRGLTLSEVFDDFEVDINGFRSAFEEFEKTGDLKIGQLSGGNRRTVEVYVILKATCKFCLLDEPFTHLSPKNVQLFAALIKEEKKNKGIIITDHQYHTVIHLADDLYLLKDGSTRKIMGEHDLIRFGYLPEKD